MRREVSPTVHWLLIAPYDFLVFVFLLHFFKLTLIFLDGPLASFIDPSAAFEQLWSAVEQESRYF